jgi:MiaB-like tRNA modifying enzyme
MHIYIESYGCTANHSDRCTLEGLLRNHQHIIEQSIDTAEVVILLTCTVIDTTEQRMLSRIRTLSETHKTLIITGCMPVVQSKLIKNIAPYSHLFTPQDLYQIPNLLTKNKIPQIKPSKIQLPKYYTTLTAPISIAEGCQQSCSYCITHIARGYLHSYPINDITKSVRNALDQGCKEIQLTAQDTAAYGQETHQKNLGNLLNSITQIPGKYRIRVGMMNPLTTKKHLNDILNGFNNTHIYKFLHLPIQSGDNQILQKMNRGYTTETTFNIIKEFRKHYSDLTLATDIIVGFPQETDNQHLNTIKLLRDIKPDIVNITRFSARPHTKAKSLSGRIPTNISKQRSRELTAICESIAIEKNKEYIGKNYSVLITKKSKENHSLGRNSNYKPIIISSKIPTGKFIEVEIYRADAIHLYGNLINI